MPGPKILSKSEQQFDFQPLLGRSLRLGFKISAERRHRSFAVWASKWALRDIRIPVRRPRLLKCLPTVEAYEVYSVVSQVRLWFSTHLSLRADSDAYRVSCPPNCAADTTRSASPCPLVPRPAAARPFSQYFVGSTGCRSARLANRWCVSGSMP